MSTIKITNLTSSGAIVGNVILPVVGNVAGTLTTLKATVDQLKTFITASAEANISLANSIQSVQISDANIGMKGYVDSVASQSIYGNANVASYLHTNNYNPYSNVNVAVFTNLSTYAYNANVTAANLGMKGYVDSLTYSNVQVATYLPTYTGNIKANFANLIGEPSTGLNSLRGGLSGIETFGNIIAQFHADINSPAHIAVHNRNAGSQAVSGFMATADIGDENEFRTLLGVTNSGYTPTTLLKPLDSLLLAIGGNLVIGTNNLGNASIPKKDIVFTITNGSTLEALRINATDDLSSANLELGPNVGIQLNGGYISGNVDFTMSNITHWTSNVNTISAAINQLAERIYNIENP